MGRNQHRNFSAGLTPPSGLTPDEEKELARLEAMISGQEHRLGNFGQTVYHQRRDELIARREASAQPSETVKEPQEDNNDDASA